VVDRLLDLVERRVASAPTEDERGRLTRLRDALVGTGTISLANIIGEVIGAHLPRG
jgi:hypothetical protein